MFVLHPQLEADTLPLMNLKVSTVLLMNDCRFPWIILVPQLENIREITDIPEELSATFYEEMKSVVKIVQSTFTAEKINIGALGNKVPQFHFHIIARFSTDEAWPNAVWGHGIRKVYDDSQAQEIIQQIQQKLKERFHM
jgi:diadenosine tetraphosphate (Ap4A) HIT family hydrolase